MTSSHSNLGKVFLVGAGPGDPGLLTLRGKACIEAANCVVYDALVNPELLQLAPQAEHVYAGKQAGRHSLPQSDINALLLSLSQRHGNVVRLKGGDPFVFGRGGEEVDALREAGLEVEVVNGLTSGIAGPASVGIAVTDRRHSPGVILVTGHPGDGCAEPDWAALAQSRLSLVVYMGVARCAQIADALIAGGLAAHTPAAVVSAAHTERQRHAVCTLATLAATVAREQLASPALLVIGEVASMAASAELPQAAIRQA